jgi:dienelactone hydrolase
MAVTIEDGPLAGFTVSPYTALGRTRDVYRLGEGPCVLVLSEMPGITPLVAEFARTVASRGLSVAMPHLFGDDGREASNGAYAKSLAQVCVSREFVMFSTGRSSPVTKWLTALAHHERNILGGRGVGVVGMCLTGGFALAMMVDDVVVAPVLSQPSLPAALTKRSKSRGDLGLSASETAAVRARAEAGQCVMGLRFTNDPLSPPERFATLRSLLGERFIGVEIDSSDANPWGYGPKAHSVLTEDLGDAVASPTRRALEQVLSFLSSELGAAQA